MGGAGAAAPPPVGDDFDDFGADWRQSLEQTDFSASLWSDGAPDIGGSESPAGFSTAIGDAGVTETDGVLFGLHQIYEGLRDGGLVDLDVDDDLSGRAPDIKELRHRFEQSDGGKLARAVNTCVRELAGVVRLRDERTAKLDRAVLRAKHAIANNPHPFLAYYERLNARTMAFRGVHGLPSGSQDEIDFMIVASFLIDLLEDDDHDALQKLNRFIADNA